MGMEFGGSRSIPYVPVVWSDLLRPLFFSAVRFRTWAPFFQSWFWAMNFHFFMACFVQIRCSKSDAGMVCLARWRVAGWGVKNLKYRNVRWTLIATGSVAHDLIVNRTPFRDHISECAFCDQISESLFATTYQNALFVTTYQNALFATTYQNARLRGFSHYVFVRPCWSQSLSIAKMCTSTRRTKCRRIWLCRCHSDCSQIRMFSSVFSAE